MDVRQLQTLLQIILLVSLYVGGTLGRKCPPGTYWMKLLDTCEPCRNICNPPDRPPCIERCKGYVPPIKKSPTSSGSVSWANISPILVPAVVGVILASLIATAVVLLVKRLRRRTSFRSRRAHLSVEESSHQSTRAIHSDANANLLHGQDPVDDMTDTSDSIGSTEPFRWQCHDLCGVVTEISESIGSTEPLRVQ